MPIILRFPPNSIKTGKPILLRKTKNYIFIRQWFSQLIYKLPFDSNTCHC